MGSQDKKDAENVQNPSNCMKEIDPSWGVFSNEKVQQCHWNSMTTEHIITTSSNTLSKSKNNNYWWSINEKGTDFEKGIIFSETKHEKFRKFDVFFK